MSADPRVAFRDAVLRVLARDIAAMQREIAAYPDDQSVWVVPPGIANSGGTLALHLVGNLRHFVGTVLGQTGFVRTRDAEFSTRDVSRDALVAALETTLADVVRTMRGMDPSQLDAEFPQAFGDVRCGTTVFLVHLATHLGYHLGQTDYHRRMVTGNGATVQTMGVPALVAPLPDVAGA